MKRDKEVKMRKNVNVVAVLFEEVNNRLKGIDQKINDQHQKLEDAATKADLRITSYNVCYTKLLRISRSVVFLLLV